MGEHGVTARDAITALIFGTRAATLTSANGATTKMSGFGTMYHRNSKCSRGRWANDKLVEKL